MNRFLLLIVPTLVGILVSSCAPIPRQVVPKYGSHSGAYNLPVRHLQRRAVFHHRVHHVADHHRHTQRRAASEGRRRLLSPWNYLPAASEPPAPTHVTPPPRITRQTPMSRNPFLTTRWGHRVIGAGRSDPSKVTIVCTSVPQVEDAAAAEMALRATGHAD
jgi:hypothetical protein